MIRNIKTIGLTAVLTAGLMLNPQITFSKSGSDKQVKESPQTVKPLTQSKTPSTSIKAREKQRQYKVMKIEKSPIGKAMGTFPYAGIILGKPHTTLKSGEQHGLAVLFPTRGQWFTTDDTIDAMFEAPECCSQGPFVFSLRRDGDPAYQEELHTGNVDYYAADDPDECGAVKSNIDIPAGIPEGHDYYLRIARSGQMCWGDSGAFSIVPPGAYPVETDETPTAIAMAPSDGTVWFDTTHLPLRWRVSPRIVPYIWWWGFEICHDGSCQDLDREPEALPIDFSNHNREYFFSIPAAYIAEAGTYSFRGHTNLMEQEVAFTIDDIPIAAMEHGLTITVPRRGYRLHRGRTYEIYWRKTANVPGCSTGGITPTVSIRLYNPDLSVTYGFAHTTNETICYYDIPAEISPGEYVFVIAYRGRIPHLNIPPGDRACMWAISDTFRIIGD